MVRGDMGGEAGGVVGRDMEVVGQEADNGLQESLRRQLRRRQCQQIVQICREGEERVFIGKNGPFTAIQKRIIRYGYLPLTHGTAGQGQSEEQ